MPEGERCPEGAEGENLAIARNISGNRTVLSPTACGRSPLAEGLWYTTIEMPAVMTSVTQKAFQMPSAPSRRQNSQASGMMTTM